jgi:acylphosphatase
MNKEEGLLYRIISGVHHVSIDGSRYKIVTPTLDIRQRAYFIYEDIVQNHRFDTKQWLTRGEVDTLLYREKIWDKNVQDDLKILKNRLDDLKIELYLKFLDPTMKKKIKKSIKLGSQKVAKLQSKQSEMDHLTLEHYAETIKHEYILSQTIYNEKDQLAFDFEKTPQNKMHHVINELHKHAITTSELRSLSRSDLWRSYWNCTSENIFPGPVYNWSDDQRMLITFTKMYDNIYENPERPEDEVIQDDDALDGWMIFIKRRQEKERKKTKLMDAIGGKYKNANEIFIVTDSAEEARQIYSLNDAQGMAEVQHIKKMGKDADQPIPWQELPHVQLQLQQQLREKNKLQAVASKGK